MDSADAVGVYVASRRLADKSEAAVAAELIGMGWHRASVEYALATHAAGPGTGSTSVRQPHLALAAATSTLQALDRGVQLLARWHRPQACLLSGLLDADECASIIALAKPALQRSQVSVGEGSDAESRVTAYARTSAQAWIGPGRSTVVDCLRERVAALTQWPSSWMEHLQVVRYGVGADFSPHHDYFPEQAARRLDGQRLATLIVYLNTPVAGGATSFPDVEMEIWPQQGNALYFAYPCTSEDSLTLHGGVPLVAGEKWIATFFLRDGVPVERAA